MAIENPRLVQALRVFGATIALGAALSFVSEASAQDAAQDKAKIAAGENVYRLNCSPCHGDDLVNTGQTFDLRRLTASDRARFDNSVRKGKNQMPPWKDVLSDDQIDQIWHYIRANAYQK
jgi:mono/diheme cytochrome c family protein